MIEDPTWFVKAARRTAKLIKAGRYSEKTSIWSATKPVYMDIQHNKCIFCERQFENREYGKIEFDLEHFRPKSSVFKWPDPVAHAQLSYLFSTGEESPTGYHWLAYDIENYAAACKPCNTILKSGFFPICGQRGQPVQSVVGLSSELPLLCNPLDGSDVDPETLITFKATTAIPAQSVGVLYNRGRVIIDFFQLNRQALHRERARMIGLVGSAVLAVARGVGSKEDRDMVVRAQTPGIPHANCVRSFIKTASLDIAEASDIFQACRKAAL